MTSENTTEGAAIGETVTVTLKPATRLRSMDGRASSRSIHARRLAGTGGRPVTLTGCQSYVQPLHPVVTLAGITNTKGKPLSPDDVFRMVVVIYDPVNTASELYSEVVQPKDVLTSFWRPWPEDVIGYNFEHELDGSRFTQGGVSYLVSYFFYLKGVATLFRVNNRVHVANVENVRAW